MSQNSDVSQLGTILGVWAHPDDETFMVGGVLHMAAQNGQTVVMVTATKGEAGVQNETRWPAAKLGATRLEEHTLAMEELGITKTHWLGYKDGSCNKVNATEAVAKIAQLIEQYQPDSIITFAPDGLTGHEDHQAVSRWAAAAANVSTVKPKVWYAVHTKELFDEVFSSVDQRLNVYFNTDQPKLIPVQNCDLNISLSDKVLDTKLTALEAMPSQYEKFFEIITEAEARSAFGSETLILASRWGDL